jgi:hypothetical protein
MILALAGPVQGSPTLFYNICGDVTGGKVCATSEVMWDGSQLVINVWNMQGSGPADLYGIAHLMTAVGLTQNGAKEKENKKDTPMFSFFSVFHDGNDVTSFWSTVWLHSA